jgi:hypothetical protein
MSAQHTPGHYRRIERAVALDLLHAVYKAEGWKRVEGESMAKRVNAAYVVTADPRRNRYIAVRKCCRATAMAEGRDQ